MSPPSVAVLTDTKSEYAVRRKQHLELIKQLRAIGAQTDLDLPRIVVIGNQSAGKSSLVEAISGITVPRDAGTCTRCPIECRLASSDGPWSCQLYIRWEYTRDGSGLKQNEVTEEPFGPLISNKADVELALRRAQSAVLNPTMKTASFLTMSAAQLKGIDNKQQFSKNVVCLDLSGPDLTDLAFVDLPGIIQNADDKTVKMVESLVVSHITGNCLILVTLPMSDDIENQKAARLAKEVDPTGARTIGVLTKPDTLTAGAVKSKEMWMKVIDGNHHKLTHGYYCTRQPDDDERSRGITLSEARAAEKKFFETTMPWSRSANKHRFGTDNLVTSMAKLLSQVIDDTLPQLQSEVSRQLAECSEQLDQLPPPVTSDPSSFVLNLVLLLCNDVRQLVEGHASTPGLVQSNRMAYARFKRDIRDSAPLFLPYISGPESSKAKDISSHIFFRFDDDSEEVEMDESSEGLTFQEGKCIYLEDVKKHIASAVTRELPDNVPYPAKIALIQESQKTWNQRTNDCFAVIQKTFERLLKERVIERAGRFESLKLRLLQFVVELMKKQISIAHTRIANVLELEITPYTQNEHYLQVTKSKYLSLYKDARAGKLVFPEYASAKRARKETPADAIQAQPVVTPAPAPAMFTFAGSTSTAFGASPFGAAVSMLRPTPNGTSHSSQTGARASAFPGIPPQVASPAPAAKSPAASAPPNDAGADASVTQTPTKKRGRDDEETAELEREALALLIKLGYTVTAQDLGKLNPPDMYETEMELMAEVRAYFQIAYKRVIDNIPMAIDRAFLYGFADSLQGFLVEKLGLGTPTAVTRCESYLAEEPHIVSLRDELIGKERRLIHVQTELEKFGL